MVKEAPSCDARKKKKMELLFSPILEPYDLYHVLMMNVVLKQSNKLIKAIF